ncbi:MAG: sigma factor-like helix-turn-helix DNA-binding protein [Clostridia bacterium]|nr:sigma factor-like helix-turn-helix DNA-binding protein [Clostridia bacterium]
MLDTVFLMWYNATMAKGIESDLYYNELYLEYSTMLSKTQREIFDMYFGMDLSLGEIAEIKNVSRQSVSDAVAKAKKQLLSFEEKLGIVEKKKAVYRLIDRYFDGNEEVKAEFRKILGDN